MKDKFRDFPAVEVRQGEVAFASPPSLLTTILGSCVAVIFWCPRNGLGGMCHGVLPGRGAEKPGDDALRYMEPAILSMIERFEAAGISKREITVKIFGGGEVMARRGQATPGARSVGTLNVEKAFEVVEREGLQVAAWDVGGKRGRKIVFDTASGEVLLRRLSGSAAGVARSGVSGEGGDTERRA